MQAVPVFLGGAGRKQPHRERAGQTQCCGCRWLLIPDDEEKTGRLLAETFFNRPEESRFSGVTNRDWEDKWTVFSNALIAKAEIVGLDDVSLVRCLCNMRLNSDRTRILQGTHQLKTGEQMSDGSAGLANRHLSCLSLGMLECFGERVEVVVGHAEQAAGLVPAVHRAFDCL